MSAQVTVVGTLKGGVGKTRLAMMAALYLARRKNQRVHVIDGDTVSQTAYKWQKGARADGLAWPIEVVRHPFADIDEYIDDVAGDHDHVIADIGGGNPAVFEAALHRAHRLLVPIGADPSETAALPETWKAAGTAAHGSTVGGFSAYVVLARTDHHTSLPREAREQLTIGRQSRGKDPYPLCDTELIKRVAYQRAYQQVPGDFLDVPKLLVEVGLVEKGTA